jgi:hypothetical protein
MAEFWLLRWLELDQLERVGDRRRIQIFEAGHQAGLRLSKGVLPGLGQEPAPAGSHRRARESVLCTQEIAQCVGNVSAHAAKSGGPGSSDRILSSISGTIC